MRRPAARPGPLVLARGLGLALALALALTGASLPGCAGRSPAAPPAGPAVSARTVSARRLPLADGRPSSLAEVTRGRVALVNFWASWCEACKVEVPALRRLHAAYAPHGVAVVGVNVGEPVSRAAEFVRAHGLTFPNLVDERQALVEELGVSGVPTTLVVDADGAIVHSARALDAGSLAKLRELLSRRRRVAAAGGTAP